MVFPSFFELADDSNQKGVLSIFLGCLKSTIKKVTTSKKAEKAVEEPKAVKKETKKVAKKEAKK